MKFLKYLFLFFIIPNIVLSKQNEVVNIRLHKDGNTERIVIENSKKINYNAFTLQNPFRLVIDLQNTNINVKAPNFKSNEIVDAIRVGKFSNTDTRLVFDTNIKVSVVKHFYLAPNQENSKHRIVIDLKFDGKDLEREQDLIGKLIEENNLYDEEADVLNELIDNILADNNTYIDINDKINKQVKSNKVISSKQFSSTTNNKTTNKTIISKKSTKPRIIIDAGHGGKDPGAIGTRGTKEKIITLAYAKSLKDALDKTGKYNVYLTRNRDVFIELRERVSIARRYKGDLFISIHADSSTNKQAKGLSIYTLSQEASDTRTAELAQKENKVDILGGMNLYGEYQDTINTLVDISRRQAMNDSKIYAKLLEKETKNRNINTLGTVVRSANFAVLTSADMPSVLLEIGFLSNKTDERMIRSYGYKTKIINSLVASINKYFKK